MIDIKRIWHSMPLGEGNDLQQMDKQIDKNPGLWEHVAKWIRHTELGFLPIGRNEIGEGAFANVAEYDTKLQNVFEAHRQYIDVQLLCSGEEVAEVAPLKKAKGQQDDYNAAGDYVLYAEADESVARLISPSSWQLFFPNEAHKPCMAVDGKPGPVRKICIKIPYCA